MIDRSSKPRKEHYFSGPDLKLRITALTKEHNLGHAIKVDVLREIYANELLKKPNRIPWEIKPRPLIKFAKQKLEGMAMKEIKDKVLPAFINKDE